MSDDPIVNLADSVKARLKNKADSLSVLYNLILTRYGIERFKQNTSTVCEAMRNTFARRGTRLPTGEEECFSIAFQTSPQKQVQWAAFLRKNRLTDAPALFRDVAYHVGTYVLSLRLKPGHHL